MRHRFVFLEDYDIAVARALYQGADVWLNNPRRPQEACGTSGMKAALNGALNCSILDGWWDELFDGENGWAITSAEGLDDERRDAAEADEPLRAARAPDRPAVLRAHGAPAPRGWLHRVKHAFATLGPAVTASRMVRDYVEQLYEPAAAHDARLAGADGDFGPARELAAWKARVLGRRGTACTSTTSRSTPSPADVGATAHGRRPSSPSATSRPTTSRCSSCGARRRRRRARRHRWSSPMAPGGDAPEGHVRYTGLLACDRAGRQGVTVRVVPSHPLLATPVELGRVAWG